MKKGKRMTKNGNTTKVVASQTPATTTETVTEQTPVANETLPTSEIPETENSPHNKTENVIPPTQEQAEENKELVMTATMPDITRYQDVVLMNRSQNYICLSANPKLEVTLAPREITRVPRRTLDELMKNPMVRRFFDKGIVTHNADKGSNVVSAHEAVAPQHLREAVERHEGGNNIVAEVKKFRKEGSLKIDL